eukprot:1763084-Pyramimonas_sp.AAC.1
MMMSWLTLLELQIGYRLLWRSNRNGVIRRDSLTYLDAWNWSAISAGGAPVFVLCYFSRGCDGFLDLTRAADEL